jgi:hypothetical protein
METHVKVLGALEIAMGVFMLLGALMIVLVFGVAADAVRVSDSPNTTIALPLIGITGMALVTFLLTLSLPGIIVGIGLLGRRPWARIAGIVLSILGMTMIPFGTIIGAYGLWVLFSKDTERLFTATTPAGPTA